MILLTYASLLPNWLVPGNVNAEGHTICGDPRPYVTVESKLYKEFGWLWWWQIGYDYQSGYGQVNSAAAAACQGNLTYRIVSTHTATGAWTETKSTKQDAYVTCQ